MVLYIYISTMEKIETFEDSIFVVCLFVCSLRLLEDCIDNDTDKERERMEKVLSSVLVVPY